MIYIIVALKAEAQAFVDKKIKVIISGIGSDKMFEITSKIVKKMSKDDVILNVGICGASKKYEIGQVIDGFKENLICVDYAVSQDEGYEIVDMESDGFKKATSDVRSRYIFKIVSDHFEPHTITKDGAKKLIFDKIDEIMERVNVK